MGLFFRSSGVAPGGARPARFGIHRRCAAAAGQGATHGGSRRDYAVAGCQHCQQPAAQVSSGAQCALRAAAPQPAGPVSPASRPRGPRGSRIESRSRLCLPSLPLPPCVAASGGSRRVGRLRWLPATRRHLGHAKAAKARPTLCWNSSAASAALEAPCAKPCAPCAMPLGMPVRSAWRFAASPARPPAR